MKTYVVIDLETTGLNPETDQITQICALKMDENGNQVGRFDTYVQLTEGRRPHPKYSKVTVEHCSTGLEENTAVDLLISFIEGSTLIIQYAPFDLSFINNKNSYGDTIEKFQDFICTRTLSKVVFPKESPSLGPTAERLGVSNPKHHDAVNDCVVTWGVFGHLKRKIPYPKSKGFRYWYNKVMDFNDREMKYIPYGASIIPDVDVE